MGPRSARRGLVASASCRKARKASLASTPLRELRLIPLKQFVSEFPFEPALQRLQFTHSV